MNHRRRPRRSRLLILLPLLVISLCGWAIWQNAVRDYVIPRNFGVVEQGRVYRSGYLTPRMLRKVLTEHEIRTIVDLGGSEPGSQEQQHEAAVAQELGVARFEIRLEGDGTGDEDDDPAPYARVLRIMADPANQPVLVHCAAGAQRTTGAVILYEHLVLGRPVLEPLMESIEQHRYDPRDNPDLLAYLVEHIDTIRTMLAQPTSMLEHNE
ncbi:MAG: tyrosine-protein phosphatase [Phycisphaerales bacterium]|nr:tyrosine-protein phosphatase [Phycisphaerales bacterium]